MTNSSPDCTNTLVGTIRVKSTSLEIDGAEDHVHILAKLPPTIAVSDFLEKLKANTSKWAKSVRRGFGWQEGYSAFTVSESQVERVRHYIQNEHHARSSFRDELIALLEAHGVKYDPDRI
jgi:putative transposase